LGIPVPPLLRSSSFEYLSYGPHGVLMGSALAFVIVIARAIIPIWERIRSAFQWRMANVLQFKHTTSFHFCRQKAFRFVKNKAYMHFAL